TILFQVLEWVEIVRMDTLISKRERNEQFFLKIPPGRILEILFSLNLEFYVEPELHPLKRHLNFVY
ncbi:hypothetical protein LEP1GSC170_0189, partial [Leptospira interrogans serovar Bataviae str. HAI135]